MANLVERWQAAADEIHPSHEGPQRGQIMQRFVDAGHSGAEEVHPSHEGPRNGQIMQRWANAGHSGAEEVHPSHEGPRNGQIMQRWNKQFTEDNPRDNPIGVANTINPHFAPTRDKWQDGSTREMRDKNASMSLNTPTNETENRNGTK